MAPLTGSATWLICAQPPATNDILRRDECRQQDRILTPHRPELNGWRSLSTVCSRVWCLQPTGLCFSPQLLQLWKWQTTIYQWFWSPSGMTLDNHHLQVQRQQQLGRRGRRRHQTTTIGRWHTSSSPQTSRSPAVAKSPAAKTTHFHTRMHITDVTNSHLYCSSKYERITTNTRMKFDDKTMFSVTGPSIWNSLHEHVILLPPNTMLSVTSL